MMADGARMAHSIAIRNCDIMGIVPKEPQKLPEKGSSLLTILHAAPAGSAKGEPVSTA